MKGIVYNVPGKAEVEILFDKKSLFKGDVMVTQFGYREELKRRNQIIVSEYRQGTSVEELADRYYLSIYAIRKIIYQK